MTDEEVQTAADQWITWVKAGCAVSGIKNVYPQATEADAYRVQMEAADMLREEGVAVIGKKIAFTGKMQRAKRDFPDAVYGFLSNENIYQNGIKMCLSQLPKRIEPELALILGEDIRMVGNIMDLTGKIEAVMPSFEIVESRMASADSCYENVIANNAGCYGAVFGEKQAVLPDVDFSGINMKLYKNGGLLDESNSGIIMGNPLNALIWLVNKALQNGDALKKGDIILSGSLLPAIPLERDNQYRAVFDIFGEVCLLT